MFSADVKELNNLGCRLRCPVCNPPGELNDIDENIKRLWNLQDDKT